MEKFENAYTDAVNRLMDDPSKSVPIVGPDGKKMEIRAGDVAGILSRADVRAAPADTGLAMNYQDGKLGVGAKGLSGKGTLKGVRQGSADRNLRIGVTHEGIHGAGANNLWAGRSFDDFNADHQVPFNQTAAKLIGEE